MVQQLPTTSIIYPDSDGKPMADNTKQFEWIVTIKENIELLYADDPTVFVAGDLLWYPVEGEPTICLAPDTLVAFTRPKGYRGSYKQWQENQVAPQVVFEILSPTNRKSERAKKLEFYNRYGVQEYYEYDPDRIKLLGWQRQAGALRPIDPIQNWVSPHLHIRFVLTPETLELYRPDGKRFLTFVELGQRLNERDQQLANSQAKAERLAAKLRELGIDPADL
jgi:Uma2 family endonuclease